eukprot:COSAG02_NODE_15869_length_1134_cov_11.089213_2_plen_82_part_01
MPAIHYIFNMHAPFAWVDCRRCCVGSLPRTMQLLLLAGWLGCEAAAATAAPAAAAAVAAAAAAAASGLQVGFMSEPLGLDRL